MFGTITERDEQIFNSSLLWLPKTGEADFYDKKRPVAFGEYVPDRAFWRLLAPDLIDLIPRGYSFGTRDGIFEVADNKVGTMICFEVAVDDISRELVSQGATILIAQTNNADFGRTNQSDQQLAIAKLRAIETGRAFINISTVGTSAMILPTGEVVQQLETYTADVMRQKLPLRTSQTPAMLIGSTLEMSNNFAALGILIYTLVISLRRRRGSAS
jgi:apolipoprotein N-acyltransferase